MWLVEILWDEFFLSRKKWGKNMCPPQFFFEVTEKFQASSEKLEGHFSQWMANKMKHIFAVDFSPAEHVIFCEVLTKNKESLSFLTGDLGGGIFLRVACNNCSLDESLVH